jgi:lipopolysaccharide/colanic/teichoic acid biosynthesis glycosyltransferase
MRRFARPLLYLGTVAIVVGLGRFHAEFIGHYWFHVQRLPWNLTYAVLLCLAAYSVGLPDLGHRRSAWALAFAAVAIAAGAVSALQLLLGSLVLPRFVVFSGALIGAPWFALCTAIASAGRARDAGRDRVVVVGGAEEQAAFETEVERDLERPAVTAAMLLPEEAHSGRAGAQPLVEAVIEHGGSVLVLDSGATADPTIVDQAARLHEYGLRVRSLTAFYDEWLGKVPIGEVERVSLMFDIGELHRAPYGRMKRLYDVTVGVVGLVLMAIVTPVVLAGNAVANRGPLFYRQPRVGRANREYEILKFRTMRPNTAGSEWASERDPRVTPWGRVLRRTHMDELPQVINILRGDQSVVGPRPEQPQYVAELREKMPFYDLRHLVRPGLTGWAQVKYPYGASELDAFEKLQYDFYYLRHQGAAIDARIIGRTLRIVAGLGGR